MNEKIIFTSLYDLHDRINEMLTTHGFDQIFHFKFRFIDNFCYITLINLVI